MHRRQKDEPITWQEAQSMKRVYGGWNNLARARPELALRAYKELGIADIGRAFVEEYAGSRRAEYQRKAYEVSRDLKLLKRNFNDFPFVGTTTPDVLATVDLNWRNSNSWDDVVSTFEEAS